MIKDNDLANARRVLKAKGVSPKLVSPQKLMKISATMQKSMDETLNLIAYLKTKGQGYGAFPQTSKTLTGKYS
mgnify:CR=1 FL=1